MPLERSPEGLSLTMKKRGGGRGNGDRGEKKENVKAKGTHTGFLFLCHKGKGNTNHVLPFTEHQKCYRASAITSCFQQIGNNFSKYGLVSQC